MRKKVKVLWIEDNARTDLSHFFAPVYMDGGYDLDIVEDASSAINYIKQTEYQALIIDIRIMAGEDEEWKKLWRKNGDTKIAARLGRQLLYTLLKKSHAEIKDTNIPEWLNVKKIGIFTIESISEIEEDLINWGINLNVYRQKTAQAHETILLDLIKEVISQ